ncbi:hypothetical protein B0537_11665 [Desulforamulus ferrireducens]|uniref:Uncharacterized protein n=1 Tax=Desulforamulus ferrireducens TaxID=1833852 RepID=A0A1S6IY34_9FIRM|nr:hypothetical protein B0537_11665 [Desulforamulus ferrireducens]
MNFNNKNSTSLYDLYDLVFLQKIRDAKPKNAKLKSTKFGLVLHWDGFGQMIYAHTGKSIKHW